jgi:hypothetical protein
MRMIAIFGIIAATVFASGADAAVYNYISAPFPDHPCTGWGYCAISPGDSVGLSVTIDESKLPKDILLNASVYLQHGYNPDYEWGSFLKRYRSISAISSPAGEFLEVIYGETDKWSSSVASNVGLSGYSMGGEDSDFGFSTDSYGRIVSWGGFFLCGGDCDSWTSSGGDGFANGQETSIGGTWTGGPDPKPPVVVDPEPPVVLAPVPLPAALPLLTLGLGALGFLGHRRKV